MQKARNFTKNTDTSPRPPPPPPAKKKKKIKSQMETTMKKWYNKQPK